MGWATFWATFSKTRLVTLTVGHFTIHFSVIIFSCPFFPPLLLLGAESLVNLLQSVLIL
jgi:hypothetical protein